MDDFEERKRMIDGEKVRDICETSFKILKNKYNLVDITLYDMFPNTNHVESVCLFKIK